MRRHRTDRFDARRRSLRHGTAVRPLIAEATRDARRAAQQFADDSGSALGAIRSERRPCVLLLHRLRRRAGFTRTVDRDWIARTRAWLHTGWSW